MDKYKKGKNVEEPFQKSQIPIKDLPEEFLWMHVNPGTKMRNVLDHAMEEMKTQRAVVWSGSGPAVSKTISCAEIMKRQFKDLHQVNKICFRKVKEYWDPLVEDLDPLVVVRELPTIHILLSKDQPDTSQPGYQPPHEIQRLGRNPHNKDRQRNKPRYKKIDSGKFDSLGLQSSRSRGNKQNVQRRNVFVDHPESGSETSGLKSKLKQHDRKGNENKEAVNTQNASPSGIG